MDGLRAEARTRLQSLDDVIPPLDGHISTCPGDLDRLWRHILSHESEDDLQVCLNGMTAENILLMMNSDYRKSSHRQGRFKFMESRCGP